MSDFKIGDVVKLTSRGLEKWSSEETIRQEQQLARARSLPSWRLLEQEWPKWRYLPPYMATSSSRPSMSSASGDHQVWGTFIMHPGDIELDPGYLRCSCCGTLPKNWMNKTDMLTCSGDEITLSEAGQAKRMSGFMEPDIWVISSEPSIGYGGPFYEVSGTFSLSGEDIETASAMHGRRGGGRKKRKSRKQKRKSRKKKKKPTKRRRR
mgnify:CR=1 FL=1